MTRVKNIATRKKIVRAPVELGRNGRRKRQFVQLCIDDETWKLAEKGMAEVLKRLDLAWVSLFTMCSPFNHEYIIVEHIATTIVWDSAFGGSFPVIL